MSVEEFSLAFGDYGRELQKVSDENQLDAAERLGILPNTLQGQIHHVE